MILACFETIFYTEFSQEYYIFVFFNRISDYHEDQSAGSEILEKHFNKKWINESIWNLYLRLRKLAIPELVIVVYSTVEFPRIFFHYYNFNSAGTTWVKV